MGRMLDALKALESRSQHQSAGTADAARATELALVEAGGPRPTAEPAVAPLADLAATPDLEASLLPPAPVPPQPSTAWIDLPPVPQGCALPNSGELSDPYLDLAERMGEQLAANYCNVVLLATPDRFSDPQFSLTQLAQALALQSPGDVLLVDGDLIGRRLSKSICPGRQGLVEVMLGVAQWPDVVHTTNVACVDFVACGQAQVPTLERSQFGWEALRPQYRAVLIGLSEVPRPESNWLAARCDAVYLVLARRHTQRQAASAATSALRACGANLMGCVVTGD